MITAKPAPKIQYFRTGDQDRPKEPIETRPLSLSEIAASAEAKNGKPHTRHRSRPVGLSSFREILEPEPVFKMKTVDPGKFSLVVCNDRVAE
jgi:hypothetical protein